MTHRPPAERDRGGASPACCAAPGSRVPTSTVVAFAEALGAVGVTARDDVYWAGRATLVRRPEDIALFDRAFAVVLGARRADRRAGRGARAGVGDARRRRAARSDDQPDEASASDDPTIELRFSATEVLRHKDFADYDDAELAEAHRLMSRLRLAGATATVAASATGHAPTARPDLRRTVRAALRSEGEPIRRHFRAPATRHRRLVLLLDVSGSMEPYARALLRFVQAAVAGRRRVEAFALGTRLTRVTRELGTPRPRPRAAAGGRARRGLVGRHPPRRRPAPLQRRVGRARHGPRRRRRDPLRRLGPWRPGGAGRGDAAPGARRLPHRLGQPAEGHAGVRPAGAWDGGRPAVR